MKSGFAVIIGRSNVGKSTLLNALVGTKIAAVSNAPQTTRHAIHGIVNDERGQIVFVDTPGILKESGSALTKKLTKTIEASLEGIDCVIYMVDPSREIGAEEKWLLSIAKHISAPKILVINKIDLGKKKLKYIEWYNDLAPQFNAVIEISALKRQHLKQLIDMVFGFMPEGEPLYPKEQLTDKSEKFWIEEIIQEKIFLIFTQEIPYESNVEVESIEKKQNIIVIKAKIFTTNDKYKSMLIGAHGRRIKEIGQLARKELEVALNKKVYLELNVETNPHWVDRV